MKRFCIIVMALCFSSSIAFASYEDALKLFEESKYRESLTMIASELNVTLDTAPESPNYKLRFLAAHNHWKLGNFESATLHFQKCMTIQSSAPAPYIDLALMLLEKNRIRDAQQVAQRGLSNKEDPMLYYISGKAAYRSENYAQAKAFFEKSIALDPELYIAYNSLGITLMDLDRFSQANTAFTAAQAIAPRSAEILNNLAYSFERMGQADKAIPYYEKALLASPENAIIKANLDRAKGKTGK